MKRRFDLIPWDAVREISFILDVGATKHGERGWEQGMPYNIHFDACISHLTRWWQGETTDPDTGKSHLLNAGCRLLFLIAYEIRGIGTDNRPTPPRD